MKSIESILESLEANAAEFKRRCEAKACSPTLLSDINVALKQGSMMSCDIDMIMAHLLDLKTKLERSNQ